ncbi:Phage head morphogenesis domain containing protein [uncultured Caudovirales phage]|uniref:Phage head morphogenesis domain containing protein n=1 Tax=uncultured Caudovirales phage TaxID=2100421 RepID=A0A6J5N2Y3_9CAUD|nr:Phage head morphogenesis domain containing protein [uncultured Caudovirales phage]
MPSQTEDQRQNWQTSKARSRWAESLLRRAQNQITIESDAVAKIQTAINAAQTEVAAILVDIQANQAPEWRVRRAQQQVAALERLDGELRSKLLTIARAAAEEVKVLAKGMPAQETERINKEVSRAVSKLTKSTNSARPEIGRSATQGRGLVAIDARSVDIAVSFVPELIADQVGTLKKAVQAEIVRNSLALTTPAESMARLTSVATPIGAFPTAAVRAEAIVRTEFGRVSNIAAMSGIQALAANPYGLSREQRSYMLDANGVMYKEWIAVGDHRTRPEHAALDGTIIPINESFMVGEYTAQFPKDPSLPAKHAVNCRCMVVPSFPPEIADRLGAVPDDGSFGDMLAMMQEGGMVGTASGGGGEAFSYAPEIPPNGFDYDIGYDPSDAVLDTFFVEQSGTTPALSGSPDATAPQQPMTVNRGTTPISIISGMQQIFNLTGMVRARSQPSSLLSFVRFASKILNTAQRRELLKPIPSAATHQPRLSVDAENFQAWLADARGEGRRKKPLKNKKKVLIDPDREIIAELPTPLIIATDESISKLSAEQLGELVASDFKSRDNQRDFWVRLLRTDDGAFGVEPNYALAPPWGNSRLVFDPKKWKALPPAVRQSIIRAVLMDEAKGIGKSTSRLVSDIVEELGEQINLRTSAITQKAQWDVNTVLLKEMLEILNAEVSRLDFGATPSDQTITIPLGTPDEGQGFAYQPDNPIPKYLYKTNFAIIGKYIPVQDLTLRVADLHREVVLKLRIPTDPADQEQFYKDMKAYGNVEMSTIDRDAGTVRLKINGFDLLMNYFAPEALPITPRRDSQAVIADLFALPQAGETYRANDFFNADVWHTNQSGELVFDLSAYIGNEQAREFILAHNKATGESIVDAGRYSEIVDLDDGQGRKIFQMHDLVDPPTPQVPIPADGRIVGVENIFNFLHNSTGVYDASLLKTHYAIGGWRLSSDAKPIPLLVLPPAINSREIAVPFFAHLEKVLAYKAATNVGSNIQKFFPFNKRFGGYDPKENADLNFISEIAEKGRVSVPEATGVDTLTLWETPPLSLAAVDQLLPELIAIVNKKRRGEQLTVEEQTRYEKVTSRLSQEAGAIREVIEWATGYADVDNSERNTIELSALHKKLTSLGLDLSEDFALWRAEKLKNTVFGELAEKLVALYPDIPREVALRRIFGIRGWAGAGVSESQYQYQRLDVFAEQNGADALDLMQFAEERGVTADQILGEARVSMLRKLYDADLLQFLISRRSSENGLRDGLGANLPVIEIDDTGVVLSAARTKTILVPAPLGEDGVTYDQLTQRPIVEVPEKIEVYDQNARMGAGELLLQDTSLPFRGLRELTLSGEEGFRHFLRTAVGSQLLGLANAGLFKSINFKTQNRTAEPRDSRGGIKVSLDSSKSEPPTHGITMMARKAQVEAKKNALALADSIGRDALHDPLQFEDVLRAVARAAVERGASESDPLIAAFLAIPRIQDAAETVIPTFWDDQRNYRSVTLKYKTNPDLDGNPHYAKLTGTLPTGYRFKPTEGVDVSALASELFPIPPEPDPSAPPDVRRQYYDDRQKIVEKRANFARGLYADPMFILRAILSRAYTKDQQRELMGTAAPFKGQMLKGDDVWQEKPVDVSWYELEATLLEILADEAAKNMPEGRSDGTLFSEIAYGTAKLTPELWEAIQILDAYEWQTDLNDETKAAYVVVERAAEDHAEQRATLIAARVVPVVEAFGFARGTKEHDELVATYVRHAMGAIDYNTVVGGENIRNELFVPAILAAGDGKLISFGKRGLSAIPAEGAGMAIAGNFRRLPRLQTRQGTYQTATPLTPQKLRLVAKAMRDHLVNMQLEKNSLLRPQIVAALNENNAMLLGGKIKAAEWAAKARELIRAKREAIREEQRRLAAAARGKPAVQVSDELYAETLKALDKDLEAAIKSLPKNKFLGVTDAQVQREIEQYRERLDDIMKGVEKTIMGNTFIELGAPDTAKELSSSSLNSPWKGKWQGHPFIIKSMSTMDKRDVRTGWGIGKFADFWVEQAAQIVDEFGGLFIRKAQAYIRELPDIKGAGGEILDENKALLMDWLSGYRSGHSSQKSGQSPENVDLMGLFDALIGNTDRHGGNYLVAPIPSATQPMFDEDGYPIDPVTLQKTGEKWEAYKIVPIDNGLAFPDPEVHLSDQWANLSPFMPYGRGTKLTPRARETLLRLWSNRSELYVRLTTLTGASRARGFFYRMIWMLRADEVMDQRTFEYAAYNPMSPNADEIIRGAFEDGQSLLDAAIAPVTGERQVRQDPNRIEGQIPALPLSDEP